jgi:hypothetical protein
VRIHSKKPVSDKLKPFSFVTERGIRHRDVEVLKNVAYEYNHYILVRATNERSIPYIGRKGYTPKQIDCKPKTADINAIQNLMLIRCAGLVVDPTLIRNTFQSTKKEGEAKTCWAKFTENSKAKELESRVFPRCGNQRGFYAVDTYKKSPNYGCLMLSPVNAPEGFRLDIDKWQAYRERLNLCYLFGDYDLYGLIDLDKVLIANALKTRAAKDIYSEKMFGQKNYHTLKWGEIRQTLIRRMGCKMIQHGSQDTVGHIDDKVYVFGSVVANCCLYL